MYMRMDVVFCVFKQMTEYVVLRCFVGSEMGIRSRSVCGRYVVGMWSVCGRYVVGMWSVCGRYVVGMWSGCGWYGVGIWSVHYTYLTLTMTIS